MAKDEGPVFALDNVVADMSNRVGDFLKLPVIFDFLPSIDRSEFYILKKRVAYFKLKNIPFAVTERFGIYQLWKEQIESDI